MNASNVCCLALAGVLAAGEGGVAPREARASIQGLDVKTGDGTLTVSFRIEGAFTPDVLDRVRSGMAVTFSHRVELLARRTVPIVPSRLLGRTVVETTVKYDTLTRQYYLSRRTTKEGSDRDDATREEIEATTAAESEMQSWMTSVQDVALATPPPGAAGRKLRVKVRTVLGRRYRLLIFPANDTVDAEQTLAP